MDTPSELETMVMVALYLTSRELTPSTIGERLGLEPTATRLKGEPVIDPVVGGKLLPAEISFGPYPSHYFILEISRRSVEASYDSAARLLEALLDELLKKVEPVADRLHQLRQHVSASLNCVYGSRHKPEWFILSDTLVRRIAALNLSLIVFLGRLEGEP